MSRYLVLVALTFSATACDGDGGSGGESDAETDVTSDGGDTGVDVPDTSTDVDVGDTGSSDAGVDDTRPYLMGFTTWPYDITVEAVEDTYARILEHADLVTHHLMGGVPWQEALEGGGTYPNLEGHICGRLRLTFPDHDVDPDGDGVCTRPDIDGAPYIYVAADSTDSLRTDLAEYWGASENEPRTGDWADRRFGDQEVVDAYITYALDVIDRFDPDYFTYATEISELVINDPDHFDEFVGFAEQVYDALKAEHPDLPLMVSVAVKLPGSEDAEAIAAAMADLMPYVDVLGVSAYPYAFFDHADRGDPANLPADWMSQILEIANGRPIAVTETGWIAEDLTIASFGYSEESSPENQAEFVRMLFAEAEALDALFVNWFTIADFDALWEAINRDPLASIWRDTGLLDEELEPRPAMELWLEQLARPWSGAP